MKDTIGLIHPSSAWHKDSKELLGQEIVVKKIMPSNNHKGWFNGTVILVNPPHPFNSISDNMHISGFRPRKVKS